MFANLALSQAMYLSRRELGVTGAAVDSNALCWVGFASRAEHEPVYWVFADGSLTPCPCDKSKEF